MAEPQSPLVLVLEDDPIHRKVLAALVTKARCEAVYAADGEVALAELEKGRDFVALLVDLHVPRIDGFTFLEKLREKAPAALKRVVIVTGVEDEKLAEVDRKAICGVLKKPIDIVELQRLLAECAARS